MSMLTLWVGLVLVCMGLNATAEPTVSKCCQKLKSSGIIPQILKKCPDQSLKVKYADFTVNCGEELKPGQLKDTPEVSWKSDPYEYYTIMMIDLDAPSRKNPKAAEWQHWIAGNIPGNEMDLADILTAYERPTPPKGTGLHRYVFLVYKQPQEFVFDEPSVLGRANFNHLEFAIKYNLEGPIAAQFFVSQWDYTV